MISTRFALVLLLAAFGLLNTRSHAQQLIDISTAVHFETQTDIPQFDRDTRKMIGTAHVTATVTTTTAWLKPAHLVIHFTSGNPAQIAMPGAAGGPGTEPHSSYYFDLGSQTPDNTLRAGDKFSQTMTFVVDRGVQFLFEPRFFARPVPTGGENQPPYFTSEPVTEITGGGFWFYQAEAVDPEGGPVSFALIEAGSSIRMTTGGLLNWEPGENDLGAYRVLIEARDAEGATSRQDFHLNVRALNRPPKITSLPTYFAKVGEAYEYPITAVDPEGKPLTFSLKGTSPAQSSLDPASGALTWNPGAPGSAEFTAVVTDDGGATDTQRWTVKAYQELGDLQILAPAGDYTILVGEPLELTAEANYADALFRVEPLPANAFFYDRQFRFVPDATQVGLHTLSFIATIDGRVASSVVTIDVRKPNRPPVLDALQDRELSVGEQLTLTIAGSDPDNDPLTFSAPGLALANAQFDPARRNFTFAPQPGQGGTHQVTLRVSDGIEHAEATLRITVRELPIAPDPLQLRVDPPLTPTFQTKQTVTGNVTGADAPAPVAPREGLITGLSPATAAQGSTATIELAGFQTQWVEGEVQARFGSGITVEKFEVLGPGAARATIRVGTVAQVGPRSVRMATPAGEQVCAIVFSVTPGEATVRGRVQDDFTSQPLAGARVAINGTRIQAVTDANGHFVLGPIPAQNQNVIVTRNNYEVRRLQLSVNPNTALDVGTIPLRALARTPVPPGSIPPGPNLASVLDRGLAMRNGGMSVEEAISLIQDTIVAVGGNQVGVIDANYQQLNPAVEGAGMFSLTPDGVRAQAELLVQGRVMPLGDFADVITTLFRFPGMTMSSQRLIAGLQIAVDAAWDSPNDPGSMMAIMAFNEGSSLSPRPPQLSSQTPLNTFQAHLLFTSFLIANQASISASLDQSMEILGIDPEPLLVRREGDIEANLRATAGAAGQAESIPAPRGTNAIVAGSTFSPMFDVQLPPLPQNPNIGVTIANPDEAGTRGDHLRQVYGKVWKQAFGNILVEWGVSALKSAAYTFAVQGAIAMSIGSYGGLGGALGGLGLAAINAAAMGLVDTTIQKLFVVAASTMAGYALTPEAVFFDRSELDSEGNFVIYFHRSSTEVERKVINTNTGGEAGGPFTGSNDANLMNYNYQIYRFPDAETVDAAKAKLVFVKPTVVEEDAANQADPPTGRLKFVIPPDELIDGGNYFRILTYQFIYNTDAELVSGVSNYDTNADGELSRQEFPGTPEEFDAQDINKDGKLTMFEFIERKAPIPGVNPKAAPWFTFMVPPGEFALSREAFDQKYGEQVTHLRNMQAYKSDRALSSRLLADLDGDLSTLFDDADINLRAMAERERQFQAAFETKQGQIGESILYVDGLSPEAAARLGNSNSAEYQQLKEKLGSEPAADVSDALIGRNQAQAEIKQASWGKDVTDTSVATLEQKLGLMKAAQRADNTHFRFDIEYTTLGPHGDGIAPQTVKARVNADADGIAQISELLSVEKTKALQYKTELYRNQTKLENSTKHVLEVEAGPMQSLYKQDISAKLTEQQAMQSEIRRLSNIEQKITQNLNIDVRRPLLPTQAAPDLPAKLKLEVDQYNAKMGKEIAKMAESRKYLSNRIDRVGMLVSNADTLMSVVSSVKTLSSRFSNCHVIVKGNRPDRSGFPPPLAVTRDAFDMAGLFRTAPDPDSFNPLKNIINNGFVEWMHPYEIRPAGVWNMGFPSDFIDTDDDGRIYVLNNNSNERYGGRIFRFNTFQGAPPEREHVGSVMYYNLNLMYSKPAWPAAMCVGPRYTASNGSAQVEVNDVFVANTDVLRNRNSILRVPTSLIETSKPHYENGQNRNRIVGQELPLEGPFKFTGPSDMITGYDPQVANLGIGTPQTCIYLSDEESIWCFYPDSIGSENWSQRRLVYTPGRRWSGLATDQQGTFYFADYAKGEIYGIPHETLSSIFASGSAWGEQQVRNSGWLLFDGLKNPGDIEIESISEHTQGTMFISMKDQVLRRPLPIVGRLTSGTMQMLVQRQDRHDPVKIFPNHGNQFRIDIDFEQLRQNRIFLLLQSRDPQTLQSGWSKLMLTLKAPGVNYLEGLE